MAQTPAQKKALAEAQALIEKQKARLAELETLKKELNPAQDPADSYFTRKDPRGKTKAQRDAIQNAFETAGMIRERSGPQSAYVNPGTGKVILTGVRSKVPTDSTDSNDPTKTTGFTPTPVTTYTASDGKVFTDQQAYVDYEISLRESGAQAKLIEDQSKAERQSAYDLLYSQFDQYGLGSLVTPLKDLITSGASPSEFTIRLRETDAYKKRFSANEKRIKNGLRALSESEYIRSEDNYQEVMRRRGLPPEYYAKGDLGVQKGFDALLAGDVSATELEDRIVTAQDRVLNANPEVAQALKAFYPGISNGDILAYSLDPANALNAIKRKITAAEIGGAAARSGLTTNVSDAEYLQQYGVTKDQAEQGYGTIAGGLQRGSQLASIYGQDPYDQATAETELFKLPGAQEARKQRQKITGLEQATFSGKTGVSSSALTRDRAGGY